MSAARSRKLAVRSSAVHGRDVSIAYHVMRAAAENLVPTTLELGGKSPVIIGDSRPT